MSNLIYYEHLEDYEKQVDDAKKYEELRKKLLDSKLITDSEWNEYQKLKKDNNELRRIYMSTAKKIKENGDDELAGYFYAQIDACPTFTVETFDWYKMYHDLKKKYDKALELLSEYNMPCEIDDFMDSHTDYCENNCSVDEEVYKKCCDKFIEWKLGDENGTK